PPSSPASWTGPNAAPERPHEPVRARVPACPLSGLRAAARPPDAAAPGRVRSQPVALAGGNRRAAVGQAQGAGGTLLAGGPVLPDPLAIHWLRARRPEVDARLRAPAGADEGGHPREFPGAACPVAGPAAAVQGHGWFHRRAAALRLHARKQRAARCGDVARLWLDRRADGTALAV